MKQFAYAILAALLVAAIAHARTIVLPVQPVVIDANGAEVPELWAPGVPATWSARDSDGATWSVSLATGDFVPCYWTPVGGAWEDRIEAVGCYPYAPVATQECPCTHQQPQLGYAAPLHVELR